MHHLAGWYQSVDPASAYVNLNALADTQITVGTSTIQVPTLNQIIALAGGAENAVAPRLRLSAPVLRNKSLFQVSPLNTATAAVVTPNDPHKVVDLRRTPLVMVPSEQMQAQLYSDPAAARAQWLMVWLADGPVAPVAGAVFTVRATGTTNLTAGAWTNCPLTFDENLPRGRYQVVGMKALSAGCVAARVLIPGLTWRPGVLGCLVTDANDWPGFRYGNMGEFGQFEDVDAISADFLSTTADAAEVVFLDLIQMRAGPG